MKEVILNKELKVIEPKQQNINNFCYNISKNKNQSIVNISGNILHSNYLEYLELCWANHLGVIISPDFIWNIIIYEIGGYIKNNKDTYRELFSNSSEKVEIVIPATDPLVLDINQIVSVLKDLCPTDIELFLPNFSTSNIRTVFANNATFCDTMSVYYNYSMFMCGIPKVKILGSEQDWLKMKNNLSNISSLLNTKKVTNYLDNIQYILDSIISSETENSFWTDIFYLKKCGSGHQTEVCGWITKLFMKEPDLRYVSNYSTLVSKVPYKILPININMELYSGLFSSELVEEYLVPSFGYIVNEVV